MMREAMVIAPQFVGTYQTPLAVADFESADPAVVNALVFHAQQAVKDGADCLLFGCAGIADQIREIEERVGVVCIPSVAAGGTQALACISRRRAAVVVGPLRRVAQ